MVDHRRLLFVMCIVSTAASADETSRWCLGDSCIGDPLAKHANQKPMFTSYDMGKTKAPKVPECKPPVIGPNQEFTIGNLGGPSYARYWPEPAFVSGGVEQYFRLNSIEKVFPEISDVDAKRLIAQIVSRAGGTLRIQKSAGGYVANGRLPNGDLVDVSVSFTHAKLQLKQGSSRYSESAFKAQPGCVNALPKL